MDALNADEVQSYLHAPEFGKKAALGETPVLRRHGASGQVAPEADTWETATKTFFPSRR